MSQYMVTLLGVCAVHACALSSVVPDDAFAALQASARAAVERLSPEERGKNARQFLELGFSQWFASCGELVFVQPGSEQHGFFSEEEHQDGGASIMHLGMTFVLAPDLFLQARFRVAGCLCPECAGHGLKLELWLRRTTDQ